MWCAWVVKAAGFVFAECNLLPKTFSMCQTEHAHSGCDSTFFPRNVNYVYLCVILLDIVLICFLASWFFNWLPELTGMPLKDLTGIFGLGASTTKPSTRQWTHHTYPHRIFCQDPIARHVGNMRWSWRKKGQKRYLQTVLSQSNPVNTSKANTYTSLFKVEKDLCWNVGCRMSSHGLSSPTL